MGFFESLFDFNGDGKVDILDDLDMMFMIEHFEKEERKKTGKSDYSAAHFTAEDEPQNDTTWRDFCEDGSEYSVYQEDFETEDEYNKELAEAKKPPFISITFGEDAPENEEKISESDFPNKRRYNAAFALANDYFTFGDKEINRREEACCRFMLDNADDITAANYVTYKGFFLYAQAIKDNFILPISLPDEDEYREYEFVDALRKIARRDVALSFEVWAWCLKTFMPYMQYSKCSSYEITGYVIDRLSEFPENYATELVRYMEQHPDFTQWLLGENAELADRLGILIVEAVCDGHLQMAMDMFLLGLKQAGEDWRNINGLINCMIDRSRNHKELETAEYIKQQMLPIVKTINIGMVRDEIDEWEEKLDKYISDMESFSKRYAYTRKNAWRNAVPDGSQFGLDPRDYKTEQEYLDKLCERKYSWREAYKDNDIPELDVSCFETQKEYEEAYEALVNEQLRREHERIEKENELQRQKREQWEKERTESLQKHKQKQMLAEREMLEDDNIYNYCGVMFPFASRAYNYMTKNSTIKIGDTVLAPFGDKEAVGIVVSVGQYMRIAAPFPVDRTKFIIRKVEEKPICEP